MGCLLCLRVGCAYETTTALLEGIFANYDKSIRPGLAESKGANSAVHPADTVQMQLEVKDISSIDEMSLSYGLEGHLRLW